MSKIKKVYVFLHMNMCVDTWRDMRNDTHQNGIGGLDLMVSLNLEILFDIYLFYFSFPFFFLNKE